MEEQCKTTVMREVEFVSNRVNALNYLKRAGVVS